MSIQESVKIALEKYKDDINDFNDLFPEDNMIPSTEPSKEPSSERRHKEQVFKLPPEPTEQPSNEPEHGDTPNNLKVKKVKKTKTKRPKRKRCTMCDKMLSLEIFNDPEKHECHKLKLEMLNRKEKEEKEETLEVKEEPEKVKPRSDPSIASKNLYNLQFTAYYMIESSLKSANRSDMDGLTESMEKMRDQYLHVFEQVYEEYGGDYLDEVLSPLVLWGMLTTQNVASTYIENKKKESGTE